MNRLDFSIKLADKQQSIYQIANDLDRVFKALSKSDTVFNQIYFIARKEEKLIDINDEQSVDLLANNLLNYSLKDIKKFDKIESPDVNYSRPYGYSHAGASLQLVPRMSKQTIITFSHLH